MGLSAADLEFRSHGHLTLGVEVEVQLVDWRTKDLCPAAPRILALAGGPSPRIQPEIFQGMLELSTGVCHTVDDVVRDLEAVKAEVLDAADRVGVEIAGAGTHPFAHARDRVVFPSPRYRMLIGRNQFIARRLAIFGVHVHVGMPDGDRAMAVMADVSRHLGHLLALSASSPFIEGHDTGLHSSRITVFESMPTAGTPPMFATWGDFVAHCQRLERSGAITAVKDLWWDFRPSPGYGTIEVRICDGGARLSDVYAIVALVQALCAEADDRVANGAKVALPGQWLLRENKWRAARWGLDAEFVVDDEGGTAPARASILGLLDRVAPHAERLGSTKYLARIREIVAHGTSADRQRAVASTSRSMPSVLEGLVREWRQDEDVREI
jgi:carboxylate-amine ligase